MRTSRTFVALEAVALGMVVILAVLAARPPAEIVVRPSPTPEPTASPTVAPSASPSLSPSPSPEPTTPPTASPTEQPTPQPTPSTVAGDRLLPFYFEIRPMFPALPPAPVIQFDTFAGAVENAAFNGLDVRGQPMFSVRHDFVMDKGTAAHEMGHAYQRVLEAKYPGRDVMGEYWAFRGFPGTWQQAQAKSSAETTFSGAWITSPIESWAEAFRAGVMLDAKERTLDYGKTIDPMAARQFFQSLNK